MMFMIVFLNFYFFFHSFLSLSLQNSNLVLTTRSRVRHTGEPSGEPETLRGKELFKFGDRALPSRPPTLDQKDREKDVIKRTTQVQRRKMKKMRLTDLVGRGITSVSIASMVEQTYYQPKTEETQAVFENLLNFVQPYLGDVPQDVLRGAADEVLSILKDDRMSDPARFRELKNLLSALRDDDFAKLIQLGKRITDYSTPSDAEAYRSRQDESEIAVVIDDEDEDDEEEMLEYVKESDDDDDDDNEFGEDTVATEFIAKARHTDEDGDENDQVLREDADPDYIDPHSIDAYWLQRELSPIFTDPNDNQQKTAEVLEILAEKEDFNCENRLVLLLGYDKFHFVQRLMKNRWKIVYCTRLQRAENEEARRAIEKEIAKDKVHGKPILEALSGIDISAKEQKQIRARRAAARRARADTSMDTSTDDIDRKAQMVDLDDIVFEQGSQFMSNKTCHLPEGSIRTPFKGYEEVIVPAQRAPPMERSEKLVAIQDLPKWSHAGFPGTQHLNRVQSKVFQKAFYSPENMLLCAPTGAGKTNVAVLCMLHEIGLHLVDTSDGSLMLKDKDFKIIYIAPMKALVQEVVGNLSERLHPYGINVQELTGDRNMTRQQISETQVIVTTPEKWDIVTRKSGDRSYVHQVKLIVIDEIHLLHDDRGPVLESIAARTIRLQEMTQENMRIVGLSATLPNYEDVATFLRVKPENLFYFDNSYRPCPLLQQYIGVTERKPLKRHQLMNEITYEKVMDQAGKNQMLIFVHSRKETATTAKMIRDMAISRETIGKFLREGSASREILNTEADSTKNRDLKDLLPYGFGIHHAGMARADRTLVEDLFADGHIQVLVSTATLAWGVNLPAHTVIIKGTQVYSPEKGRWTELSPLDVMQMFGRAGRPQYDKRGEGIIITTHQELQFYLSLLNQQLPIESQYVKDLADNLNAEIVLGTIQNVREAVDWLGYTYLYVRMMKNPALYGVDAESLEMDPLLEQRRTDLIHTAATILDRHGLIKYDRRTGSFQSRELGRVSSHYYVSYKSIATFNDHLKPTMSDIELFRLFSLSEEFKHISVRQEEKLELQKMIERVPIPVKETIDDPSAKINVLLQAYISRLRMEGFALISDMTYVTQSAARIVRALFEICLHRGWAQLTRRVLGLAKMIEQRMWGSHTPLRQFSKIPEELVKQIEKKDVTWDMLYDLSPAELGDLVRYAKIGRTLYRYIHQFPRLELTAHVQPITRSVLRVDLTIAPDFEYDERIHGPAQSFWITVEDVDSEIILHQEPFTLRKRYATEEHHVTFTVPIFDPLPPQYFIRVYSDRWLGSESVLPLSFRNLILPAKYPPPTELLDLQPLSVSGIRNEQYQKALFSHFSVFNPIQTQCFNSLYNGEENVLIAAPNSSGKTVCAEIAILRMFNNLEGGGRCVYVLPMEAMIKRRLQDWKIKFGDRLGKVVSELTGDINTDSKLLENSHIILTTPQKFDIISRRWKVRKVVQRINLFIADELHHVGGDSGPIYEVILSRMRYISLQQDPDQRTRILGLSASVANAKDLGEWIGASMKKNTLFNFHPNVRPVPLEIRIQGFTQQNHGSRMLAMSRPTYMAIKNRSAGKSSMVFVESRRQARFITIELIKSIASETSSDKQHYLDLPEEELQPFLDQISNRTLRHALQYGVAFYHDGLSERERTVVEQLYTSGAIKILVCVHVECWGMDMDAHLVVIMGTQYYDGRDHRYVDYTISEVLQMIGRASRPLVDDSGKCLIMCHAPKKEYYKKFLFEPFPVESHLDRFLPDHMNAEIVTKSITTKQNAVDYLTWTFLYRRLRQNPNYYNLHGTSYNHMSDYLSELVENTLKELQTAKCIAIEEAPQESVQDDSIVALNLGIIAAHYYIQYTTIELFNDSLTSRTKIRGLIEILAAATEFDSLPIRQGEDEVLRRLSSHVPEKITNPRFTDPHTKANILLQTHFSRQRLNVDLERDKKTVLLQSLKLIQAMVDVISSNRSMKWLRPALAAMELSQMIVQAMWKQDSFLMQVPHFDKSICQKCAQSNIETVFDLIEMDDGERNNMLQFTHEQMVEVAHALNRYPSIEMSAEVEDADDIFTNDAVTANVKFEVDEEDVAGPIHAPFFPAKNKTELWWIVIGDPERNALLSVRQATITKPTTTRVQFIAPKQAGQYKFSLYLMCDSYAGTDSFVELPVQVQQGEDEDDLGDDGDSGDDMSDVE